MSIRQRLFGSTVARRIFATFFIASLVPVGLAVALVLTQVRETMELQAHRQLQDLASSSSRIILDRLVGAGALLAYLPGTSSRPPHFEAAWIQTSAGPQALFGEPTAFGDMSIELGQTRLYLSAAGQAVEILLGKNIGGQVLLARIDREYLWEYSELMGSGLELCVLVAATQARLSCSPGASVAASATVWEALAREGQGSFELPAGGFEHLAAYRQVPLPAAWRSPPWSIVVGQPKDSLLAPLATFARAVPQALALGLVLILLFSLRQIRRILRPLNSLVAGTRKIADRHFATRFKNDSDDEFGALGGAMNDMAERLGRQFDTLTALAKIDRLILSSGETEQVLDAVLDGISDVVPGCDIGVLLIDPSQPERGRLYCRSHDEGRDNELVRTVVSQELRAWLAQQSDGALHGFGEIRKRLAAYPERAGGTSVFVMPILHGDVLQGALFARFASAQHAVSSDFDSVREFASRCAVAISASEREQKLLHRANFDALTGLPNRQLCYDRLRQALAVARREDHKLAVLFIDLDGFKHVNDSLGHSSGDQLLRETALRLSAALRDTDTVARLGGDEYVVILPHVHGALEAEVIVGNIMDTLKWPFCIDGQMAFVSASIGVTIFPDDARTVEGLLRKADTAMYSAKDAGRARYIFFAKEMDDRAHERLALHSDLRSALTNGELFLVYQPQVDLRSGEVICAEALLRWRHPTRGLVPVELFLPVLEETGLVESIGSWVLQTAMAEFARWKASGSPIERVAVNTATRQLFDVGLADLIDECLHLSQLPGSCLEIELTESSLVTDFVRSDNVLKNLALRGVRLAIDDFGTGYSSLGYLKDLTFDMVKIDRAFISGLPDEKSLAIVKAVLGMAHSLGKQVVAEGIESELQRAQLSELGCDIGQGFLLGRPLAGPAFAEWLQSSEAANLLNEAFALNA